MNIGVGEKLNEVKSVKSFSNKVKKLKQVADSEVKFVLGHTYDPRIRIAINPVDIPEYKPQPKDADLQNVFKAELKRFYILLDCEKAGNMPYETRMEYLRDLLEMVDPDDAEMVINMIKGSIPGVSLKVYAEAYPHLVKDRPKLNEQQPL